MTPRRWAAIAVVLLLAIGGALAALVTVRLDRQTSSSSVVDNGATTTTAVVRTTVTSRVRVPASVVHQPFLQTAVNHLSGTVTWVPSPNAVVTRGQPLWAIDGQPVLLMYGNVPAYRTLSVASPPLHGDDVSELEKGLLALGDAGAGELRADGTYTDADAAAVKRLQARLGLEATGAVEFGRVVFMPGPVRIADDAVQVGGQASAGSAVVDVTTTDLVVSAGVNAAVASVVSVGDAATVLLASGARVAGTVTAITPISAAGSGNKTGGTSSSDATATVSVTLANPPSPPPADGAAVTLEISQDVARDVLAVPVTALVALAGGGDAVEVVDAHGGHRLVPVEPGTYDDTTSLIAVRGAGLDEGARVVVPAGP